MDFLVGWKRRNACFVTEVAELRHNATGIRAHVWPDAAVLRSPIPLTPYLIAYLENSRFKPMGPEISGCDNPRRASANNRNRAPHCGMPIKFLIQVATYADFKSGDERSLTGRHFRSIAARPHRIHRRHPRFKVPPEPTLQRFGLVLAAKACATVFPFPTGKFIGHEFVRIVRSLCRSDHTDDRRQFSAAAS